MKKILRGVKKQLKNLKRFGNQLYFSVAKNKLECNICGYKANRFASDPWHQFANCPHCESRVRHRLLWAALENSDKFTLDKVITGKDILHFAPEKALRSRISPLARNYKTADLVLQGYAYSHLDYNIDISNLSAIKDESFHTVIVFDVLQQVPDHIKAMKEVQRILKKGGYFITTVPQKDGLATTIEGTGITDRDELQRQFGQPDHLRMYGDDFNKYLENVGFDVSKMDKNSFPEEYVQKHVLHPPVLSKNPIVTNFRRIYIGAKKN